MTTTARVDVVIPCYKYGHYLRNSVGSVLSQAGVDVRVLIIDDASPDKTGEIAEELSRQDKRIDVIRHAANRGHIQSYNEGIDWTSGDYWLLLSADDMLAPGALARAAAIMSKHPSVGLTYGRALKAAAVDDFPAPCDRDEFLIIQGADFLRFVCETASNPVPTPTAVVRTSLQKSIGGYLKDLPHSGDAELWMRIAVYADVCALKACQALYRWHGANMQLDYLRPGIGDLAESWQAFETVFANHGMHVPDRVRLSETANRVFAEQAFWKASRAFDGGYVEAFDDCLEFARKRSPALTRTAAWRRLQCKAMLGPRLWTTMAPLVNRFRSTEDPAPKPVALDTVHLIGAWPAQGPTRHLDLA